MTFLPSFLLAIISTLDLTNKKSLSILISHPYLVLLPTFTMFSYSKLKICGDKRVALSPRLSILNVLLNAVVFLGIFIVLRAFILRANDFGVLFWLLLLLPPPLAALFTLLFLFLKKISCCACCRSAGRLVRVFDPEQPEKTFIMEGGEVVELTETDIEHTEMTGPKKETEEDFSVTEIEEA